MSKSTNIPSEILNFFTEKRINPAFSKFMTLLEGMKISDKDFGSRKRGNCQLTNLQIFQIILILPFMAVSGFSHYAESSVSKLFGGRKDILYSFMAKDNIDWRSIIRRIVCHLVTSVTIRKDYQKSHLPAVLIADDSDLPKTGLKMECIGKIFVSKLECLKSMVKDAIRVHIPFDYLLVDSWFVCTELVDFVYMSHKKFHLLGMAKMGNTKYKTESNDGLTAKAILNGLKKSKSVKYSRRYRCHHSTVDVTIGERKVRLFFCRRGKNEKWRLLLTTDLSIDFMRAYEIYAMRWSIEVFFSDAKRLLDLAGCSARDFSSQIAHVSMVVIRYNILALIKRSDDYETIGGLFADIYEGVHELTVVEKIWSIIIDVITRWRN